MKIRVAHIGRLYEKEERRKGKGNYSSRNIFCMFLHSQREPLNVVFLSDFITEMHVEELRQISRVPSCSSIRSDSWWRRVQHLIARQGSYLMCACTLIATPEMCMSDMQQRSRYVRYATYNEILKSSRSLGFVLPRDFNFGKTWR